MKATIPANVDNVFNAYPTKARKTLLSMRSLILRTAAKTPEVGKLSETLKWGQPAYLTDETKAGSTIRLAYNEKTDTCDVYFNCQSRLVEAFRARYGKELTFSGNRAIKLEPGTRLPSTQLEDCFTLALTYHLIKKDALAL